MKDLLKRLVMATVRRMPYGAKNAIFTEMLEGPWRDRIESRVLSNLHVSSITVQGQYGAIEGCPDDYAIFRAYCRTGLWATRTNKIITDFFKPQGKGIYLDIGANIGLTTMAVAANPDVKCMAFEPDPTNFSFLERNVSRNCKHGNVELYNIALFNRVAELELELSAHNLGDHRLRVGDGVSLAGERERETVRVKARPLDEFQLDGNAPLAVKMDTQGAEPFVCAGGRRTLEKAQLLILEFTPYQMHRMGVEAAEIYTLLSDFTEVQIARGEDEEPTAPMSGKAAVDVLKSYEERYRTTPYRAYWDVIARRN